MASVFLSYDHDDVGLARPIAAALEKAGHSVWYDRHIHGGAQYSRKIEQALDAADAVVVLWTPNSLESAWVRDEAAEGRDRGKLVPLTVDGVSAPMGFRQFQTIDLGAWKGRGKVPRLAELLEAISSQGGGEVAPALIPRDRVGRAGHRISRRSVAAVVGVLFLIATAFAAWTYIGRSGLPIVSVEAGNASPRSQAAASDLFVKLGSLAQVGAGKWQLIDGQVEKKRANLVFRTADLTAGGQAKANLVFLDGKNGGLLWSGEFAYPAAQDADLRQRLSLTAGRVLGCALETIEAGGLRRDLYKLFLTACAKAAELSSQNYGAVLSSLRPVVKGSPKFLPAWSRLLDADLHALSYASFGRGDERTMRANLQRDMAAVRRIAPDLPALTVAEWQLLPPNDFERAFALFSKAIAAYPDDPRLLAEQGGFYQRTGLMSRGAELARRVAELDPLSPVATTNLVLSEAYAGRFDEAREELAKAERTWAGTGALEEAQWAFHLRFGDPKIAMRFVDTGDDWSKTYLTAREEPSPANVSKLFEFIRNSKRQNRPGYWPGPVQAFAEFGAVDDAFHWLAREHPRNIAIDSYILFRPGLKKLREDPRFLQVAKRAGLLDFWRKSGKWPDFCMHQTLPYDCKAEAAKYE